MKQSRFIQMIIGLILLAIIAGCDASPESNIRTNSRMLGSSQLPTVYVPYNTDNPYDSIGVMHNDAIIYALCQLSSSDSTTALCVARTKLGMVDWMTTHLPFSAVTVGAAFDSAGIDAANINLIPINNLLNSYSLSVYAAGECDYINRIIQVAAMSASVDEKRDSILAIEYDVVHGVNPTPDILCTISIAKYSLYLWTHAFASYCKTSRAWMYAKPAEYLMMPYIIHIADVVGYIEGSIEAARQGLSGCERNEYIGMYKTETSANAYCMYYEGADRCEFYELMNCGN